MVAAVSSVDELNEIWDEDHSESSVSDQRRVPHGGLGSGVLHEQLATISEPEGEDHESDDSSSGIGSEEDVVQHVQRYGGQGAAP